MSKWRRIATAAAVLGGGVFAGGSNADASPDALLFEGSMCDDMVTLEFFPHPGGTGGQPGDYADILSMSVNVGIFDETGFDFVYPWIAIDVPGLEVGQRLDLEGQFRYVGRGVLDGVELPEDVALWFRMEYTWGRSESWLNGPTVETSFVEDLATEIDEVITQPCPPADPPLPTEPPVITEAPVITEPPVVTEPPTVTRAPADTAAPVTKAPVSSSTIAAPPVLGDPPQANASPVQALSPAGIAAVEAPLRQQLPSTGGGGSSQMLVLAAAGAVLLGGALLGATRRR